MAKLEEELSAKSRAFNILEEKLKSRGDYEEIKRELRFEIFCNICEKNWLRYKVDVDDFEVWLITDINQHVFENI